MDLSKVKAKEVSDLNIVYPDGEETGVVLQVQSVNASGVRRVLKKWDNVAARSKKGLNFEQKEQASVELLRAAIVGWSGLEEDGVELECTDENKLSILKNKDLRFMRDQVDEFVGDSNNFFSRTEAD